MKPMNRNACMKIGKMVRTGHLWLGLLIGALWALQGVTGALLVFHREADQFTLEQRPASPPLALDGVLDRVRRDLPLPVESLGVADGSTAALNVTYTDRAGERRSRMIDRNTGETLKDRQWRPVSPADGNIVRWLYNLHHQLLGGEASGYFLGVSGLLLGTSVVWGVWLAWPNARRWSSLLDMAAWRTSRQRLFGWHRLIGLCAMPILLLLAFSGAAMDFDKQLRGIAASTLSYRAPYSISPRPVVGNVIGVQRAVALAQFQLPAAKFVAVSLPNIRKPVYQVRLKQPAEWRSWSGTSMVTLDPNSGKVLDVYDASTAPAANRLLESAFAVHSGEAAGLFGRFVVLAAGLSLPVLYILGVWSWLRRRRKRHIVTLRGIEIRKPQAGSVPSKTSREE